MRLDIYLNYPGNREQAFRFYEQELRGRITTTDDLVSDVDVVGE